MRAVGKFGSGAAACFAASLALMAIPVGLGHAESPAPASPTAACPPSPAVLAGSATTSPAPAGSPAVLAGSATAGPAPAAATPSPASAHASPYQPSPEEVVACVGSQEIDGATFSHWAGIAENAALSPAHRHPAAGPPKAVMVTTMGFLTSADWVTGEAADLGIELSAGAVHHEFDRLRREQFPRLAAFTKFLRRTGQTTADLLLRVRLSMLTARIQQRVAGHGSARRRRRALARFLEHFERKWKAQTYCETLYKVPHCGHTAGSL
jgi:hypothetical protein